MVGLKLFGMRIFLLLALLIIAQQGFTQLKGAVPQSSAPAHIKGERKPDDNSAVSLAKNNAAKMKKSLRLTDKQHADLYAVFLEYETGVEKTAKSKLSKKEQFDKMNLLNSKKQEKMKAILTKEQYHAYIMSFP
jgi:hypothetical protein